MLGEEKDKYQCHLLLSLQGHGDIAALKFAKTQNNYKLIILVVIAGGSHFAILQKSFPLEHLIKNGLSL